MKIDHPAVEDFDAFLRKPSQLGNAERSERNAHVMRHLLAGCRPCHQLLVETGWGKGPLDRLFSLPAEHREVPEHASRYDYSEAFSAAERALTEFFAEGRPSECTPEDLMAELSPLPLDEQARWVESYRRFANPLLVKRLVEASHGCRYENPARMLQLAHLARLAAGVCKVETTGSRAKLADLQAQGWRQYGNALRISGRIREAEEALTQADRLCAEGTGDPPLRAILYEDTASLRIFQRRFAEAIGLAEGASCIYRELGEIQGNASALVRKAIALLYSGEAEAAVRTLNQAIPLIDQQGDPHLLFAACHNLICCYIDLGRPEQALSIYFEARDLYREFNDSLISLRAGWQEGQLLRDLGHLRAAEESLLRARQGFLDRDLSYEAALVSLDLAAVYLKLDETESLQRTVSEMVPIFKALGVDREALAALLQLQKAADQSRQSYQLIRFLNTRLEQLPHHSFLK